jgi:hypothetical protein
MTWPRAVAALAALLGGGATAHALWPAPAARTGTPVPGASAAGVGAHALVRRAGALVDVVPARLGYRLVVAGPRAGVRAQTDRVTRTITITLFVGPGEVVHRVAHDLAHELGHAYDDRRMTPALRRAYLLRRGAPADRTWWPGDRSSDYDSGAGDFAEVFAACHAASPEFRSRMAPRPAQACSLLPAAARAPHPKRGSRR